MCTPFDEPSLNLLEEIGVDAYKIASFDCGNLPFINSIVKTNKPIIVSCGGANSTHIQKTVEILSQSTNQIALLHCVSEYPCPIDKLDLSSIQTLIKNYPDIVVGVSDHFNGTLSGPLSYMSGARVFEKHVTMNRSWKGSDHSFALEPEGFRKFVRDIKRVPLMYSNGIKENLGQEPVFLKLGKSIIASADINLGEKITLENITGKILSENVIPVRESHQIIGSISKKNLKKGDVIHFKDIEKINSN